MFNDIRQFPEKCLVCYLDSFRKTTRNYFQLKNYENLYTY